MKRVVNSSIAFVMMFAMLLTSGIVANASELQGNTEYRSVLESITEKQSVDNVNSVEKLDTTDTIKNVDSDFKSCRLIITNKEDMEFEDKDNTIKSVQHIDNIYIVEYFTVEATEQAYNDYLSNGYEVELDTVKDAPEGVSNKDKLDNEINKEEIATTNEKKDVEKLDKINKDKDKEENKDKKDIITVAVLDTGLNVGEDIFTDRLVEGKSFVDENSDKTEDVNGHGTTMARLILDTVNDVNAENNIKIMPIKILNDEGKGTTLSAYKGIKYLIEEKQKNPNFNVIINISASGMGNSKLLNSVINEAYNNGIPVVVSAGNDNKDIKDYTPANVNSAFTISSAYEYEDAYYKSIYSNYGNGIDYCTSGDYEYTRIIDEKEVVTKVIGTSVSSAYVTGYIALLKQMANSDEDGDNDKLSITDIDNSLCLSAIALDDNKDHFGKGYLLKENIVLDPKRIKDKELDVDNVAEVNENIQLMTNYSWVTNRTIYVRDLPANGNWFVQVYINRDSDHQNIDWSSWVTKDDPYHGVGCGGGAIHITKKDDKTVEIFYDHCNISEVTPWIKIGVFGDNNTKIIGIGRAEPLVGHWNSAQTQTREEHYKDDEWWVGENAAGVDVYCGIGASDFGWGVACVQDFVVDWTYTPKNFTVTYDTNGGAFRDGKTSVTWEYDGTSGNNWFGVGIGASETPTKPGYNFRGWYISDNGVWRGKHTITNLIDYENRNGICPALGTTPYNMSTLNWHFWTYGIHETSRLKPEHKTTGDDYSQKNIIAEHCSSILDVFNGYDFDNYRQLLPANTFLTGYWSELCAGQNLVATAIWTPKTYSVKYNYNNGYNESETQSCQFDSAYKVHATPSKYKSANLVFDSNGGSAVGNIKVTKTFLGWDSDLDINNSGNDYRRSTSSAYDTKINNARYINKNKDLYDAYGGYNNYMAYAHYVLYGQYEAGRPATKTGSGDINDSSNYYQPGKNFRNLSVNNNTINMTGRWKANPQTLPSATKEGYDFLGWQINGTGKIYREEEKYVPSNDNDVTFVAVWRRNEGQIRYNANGAVDDNNREFAQVTDDTKTKLTSSYVTKSGNIFGTEYKEDTFVKNETTKNKVGTTITNKYILNDGDIINTLGTTDKLSTFQGWSSINYARHDTPNILYNGYVSKFMNIYYDVTAVNKLKIANAPNPYTINNVITRANQIVTHRNNNISKWKATPKLSEIGDWFEKLTTSKLYYDPSLEGNGIVNMYATWDEFPAFTQVDDVSILSSDLSKGKDWIEDRIMRDVVVTDREYEKQGRLPYGELPHNVGKDKGKVGIEVVDLDLDAMREIGTGMTGGISVTIQATDSAGHITKTQIMLYVNQVTSEEDLTGEMKDNYTRFINKDSYEETYENGGIYKKSKWQNPATSKYGVKAYYDELMI